MALLKQKLPIALSQGVNTKVDPKQRPIGTMNVLENVIFPEPGKLIKRNGYDMLSTDELTGTITNPKKLANFKDELCLYTDTNFFSYSSSTDKWTDKGVVSNIFPTSRSVVRNTYEQSNIASKHVNGLNVYAWEDGRGGIRVSIIDDATGNELLSDTNITASGTDPKVEFIGNEAYFFYVDAADVKYRKVNPINPSTIDAEVVAVTADLNAGKKLFDTVSTSDEIVIVWYDLAGTMSFRKLQADGTLTTTQVQAGEAPSVALSVTADSFSRLAITYYNGTAVKYILRSFSLIQNVVAPTVIETIANVTNCSATTLDEVTFNVYYEVSAASESNHLIRENTIDTAATVGTPSVYLRSVGLATEPFTYNNAIYIPVIHKSEFQSTLFLANETAQVVSKIAPGLSGDLLDSGTLSSVSEISEGNFLLAHQIKGKNVSEGSTFFSVLGVQSTELEFDKEQRFENSELGENLHTSGGVIQSYDGKEIVEHGFHLFPEGVATGANAVSGGSMSDGTYQYVAVYNWTDNKGQEHRSAPSIPISVTTSAGGSSQTQAINVPTIRLTQKTNVVIELYRTEDTGIIFYKTTSTTAPEYNDKTVDTIAIVDTKSDAQLISGEILYTTGGVLDNISAPSAYLIASLNDRLFLAGLEDENKLQYSKIRNEGKPVEFNDTLTINVNSTGGPITALAAMDDKLIIFKDSAIFYLSGNGPNNLGEQDNFIDPELVSADVGCISPKSIVLTPQGLMFKSKKGIYMLSRSLQTMYIGAPVEEYNSQTIASANLKPDDNQVIFLSSDGNAIVFNYFVQKWTTFSNHQGVSGIINNDIYYYIRSNGDIFKESDTYTDAGSHIKLVLETSWMSLAGTQNYKRVYRALILGEYKSEHKLIVRTAYNFLDAFVEEKVLDTADFTSDTTYGGDSPYGTGTPYGGTGNQYQLRVDFKTQKCQSIKIRIEDSQDTNYGEGLSLSNILMVVGSKGTEYKPAQSRIYGTN